MSDIATRLQAVIDEYGPESFSVSTSNWNTSTENGMGRRVMNLLGSPNWMSGVAMCMGNTAAVNKLTYGWFPWPDLLNTDCIVLFGHNPRRHSWVPIYDLILQAQAKGGKLIVLDPRVSGQAERADVHLPLRSGTDAAMLLSWLRVILDEELYDQDFVRDWTVGVVELRERVAEYSLERVEEITGARRADRPRRPDVRRSTVGVHAVVPDAGPTGVLDLGDPAAVDPARDLRAPRRPWRRADGRVQPADALGILPRAARGAVPRAAREAVRLRPAPGLHLPRR